MSFTYNQPWTTTRDYVRYLIQDTVSANALFQDEELDSLLLQWGSDARLAAAEALEALAGLYARNAISYSTTRFTLSRTQIYKALLDRAKALREAAINGAPFEFESVMDAYVDSAGIDRSNYMNSREDGAEDVP